VNNHHRAGVARRNQPCAVPSRRHRRAATRMLESRLWRNALVALSLHGDYFAGVNDSNWKLMPVGELGQFSRIRSSASHEDDTDILRAGRANRSMHLRHRGGIPPMGVDGNGDHGNVSAPTRTQPGTSTPGRLRLLRGLYNNRNSGMRYGAISFRGTSGTRRRRRPSARHGPRRVAVRRAEWRRFGLGIGNPFQESTRRVSSTRAGRA